MARIDCRTTLSLLLFSALAFASASPAQAQNYKIGCYMALTGPLAQTGLRMRDGMRMALDDFRKRDSRIPASVKIDLQCEDAQARPDEALSLARRFGDDKAIVAVIGGNSSAEVLTSAAAYTEAKLPSLAPTALHPDITKVSPYLFRVNINPMDAQTANAKYAVNLGKKKVAIIAVQGDYGRPQSMLFTKAFEADGRKIAMTELIKPDQQDFRAVLTEVRRVEPDLIVLLTFPPQSALIMRQARQLNLPADILLDYGNATGDIFNLAGDVTEGKLVSLLYDADQHDAYTAWQQRFTSRFNAPGDAFAVNYYVATSLVLSRMAEAYPNISRERLREGLESVREFKEFPGTFRYDPTNREWAYPVSQAMLAGGKFVPKR